MIDTTRIKELIEELKSAKDATKLPLAGLNDLLELDIIPTSRKAVEEELTAITRRATKIVTAQAIAESLVQAIDDLLSDGYPLFQHYGITVEIQDDLNAQLNGIDAAIDLFVIAATDFTATISPERPTA